ncbi:GNAT family N-acetyltransferase [Paenibacillus sp. NPDC057934]|uniref:GNAT family N-acetyltransferase n=1 Tax=Paenibacillus sp. NPDC057934 TaxID=3346282 RepID=UPI0036DD26A2
MHFIRLPGNLKYMNFGWNVAKEQREEWLIHYEIPENGQFLKTVAEGGDIGELRLRLGIVLKETGELIGWGASGIKDELPAPNREIMYAISRDHRGKGYATQAVQGIIELDNESYNHYKLDRKNWVIQK